MIVPRIAFASMYDDWGEFADGPKNYVTLSECVRGAAELLL
jgi:hypothetical protein